MTIKALNNPLNHSEFIVLGLIAEEPSHAYKLDEKIEERGMRDWTSIGTSSIYRVIKDLEKAGYAERWIEEIDNRVVKVYKITEKGLKTLKIQVYSILKEFIGKNDEDFYVAFSMLPIIDKEKQVEAISYSINKMKRHRRELQSMLQENSKMPINVTGLFIHPIRILETDINFLEEVLKKIKNGKGKAFQKENLNKEERQK